MSEPTGPTAKVVESVSPGPVTKLIVAVHGVGKQYRYATIQSVAERFGSYCGHKVGTPLGSFHLSDKDDREALPIPRPAGGSRFPKELEGVLFAEVFWANIPDEAVKQADTVEETKTWAKTVVERVRALDCKKNARETINYKKTSAVVAEMIETISVLESLLLLGRKVGVVEFDLQELLTDYVCDIQIVTEFATYRRKIFEEFHSTLRALAKKHKPDEIHIIAHSEGTVISFLGLLQAMSGSIPDSEWVDRVVGFMTIGSPIDKHLVMWPDLWKGLKPARSSGRTYPIQWRNYYDNGDPVGFQLDTARSWLKEGGWLTDPSGPDNLFHFTEQNDHGFTRYYFPGKAHNDYWKDDVVFDHFISTVIRPPKTKPLPQKKAPSTRPTALLVSWVLPYVICFLLLLAGTYFLYKPVSNFVSPEQKLGIMVGNVFAIATLLAGMTVLARVPRLVTCIKKYAVVACIFALSVWGYMQLLDSDAHRHLNAFINNLWSGAGNNAIIWVVGILGVLAGGISYVRPEWGLKPIVIMLGLVAAGVVWGVVSGGTHSLSLDKKAEKVPLWPVFLGGAAFLYLWWLSALIFDLAFVWHRYIRGSLAKTILCQFR